MIVLMKIAFRNIIANRKRSVLIGITIFFSALLLLILDSSSNGIEIQLLRRYINIQSGNVAVIWEDLKKVSNQNMSRLSTFNNSKSFDVDKDSINILAIARLNEYIKEHQNEIKYYFPTINRQAKILAGGKLDNIIIYSLTNENKDLLIDSDTLRMEQGVLFSDKDYSICISRARADYCNVDIDDSVTIEVMSPYGAKNILEFLVTGIYDNGFGWNRYSFVSQKNARELYDFDPGYFDIGRIYLKNSSNSSVFAEKLDKSLLISSKALRAESSAEASAIATDSSQIMKLYFNIFILFMLIMIAIGLRVTIKMNLFERMKEFGTIRAIGFSRMQNYAIIFFEIFFLSMICLTLAFVISCIYVIFFGNIGLYVGQGAGSFLGGDRFYPKIIISDIIFTLIIMIIFSLISTFSPGIKISYQNITDLLLKKQRKIFLIGILFKKIFGFISLKDSKV